jgi:hypothetical protein
MEARQGREHRGPVRRILIGSHEILHLLQHPPQPRSPDRPATSELEIARHFPAGQAAAGRVERRCLSCQRNGHYFTRSRVSEAFDQGHLAGGTRELAELQVHRIGNRSHSGRGMKETHRPRAPRAPRAPRPQTRAHGPSVLTHEQRRQLRRHCQDRERKSCGEAHHAISTVATSTSSPRRRRVTRSIFRLCDF